MPRKNIKEEYLEEPVERDYDAEEEQEPEEPEPEPIKKSKKTASSSPSKPKKVLTEKQLQALAEGRKKGVEKLKQKGETTRKQTEVVKRIKELKKEAKVENTQQLEKIADASQVRLIVENLNNRFDAFHNKFESLDNNFRSIDENFRGYLTDKQKRHEEKKSRVIQETVKRELPRAVNDVYLNHKLKKEQSNNPFLGLV
jgi:hypothetical protein